MAVKIKGTSSSPGYSLLTVLLFAFFSVRMVTLVSVSLAGLADYSDVPHFFNLAQISGWPFLSYWVEYPPLFPFLSKLIYLLVGGTWETYLYVMLFLFTLADAGNLILFYRIACHLHQRESLLIRALAYLLILAVLPYSLRYFDPLAVFLMLLSIWLLVQEKDIWASLAIGLGFLTKMFPALVLVWVWRRYPFRRALLLTLLAFVLPIAVYGILLAVSPDFTLASLVSQGTKGSWETVWALIDGNQNTGLFGPLWERLDPSLAWVSQYQPPVVSPYLSLIVFAGIGFFGFLRSKRRGALALISLIGLAWTLMMLWSSGWSVQWVLYILPLILLVFPDRLAVLLSFLLILDNILEYPLAVTKGLWTMIVFSIILRSCVFIILALYFYRQARSGQMVVDNSQMSARNHDSPPAE